MLKCGDIDYSDKTVTTKPDEQIIYQQFFGRI